MTDLNAGQSPPGNAFDDMTPSQKKIYDIEQKYTGPNYDPNKMISSDDVKAAIAALDEETGPDVPGRSVLAGFLYSFGGNDTHPEDHFLPTDRAAMTAAILKGIDSIHALAGQHKLVQADVLQNLVFNAGIPQTLGFSIYNWVGLDVTAAKDRNTRDALEAAVNEVEPPKGYGPQLNTDLSSVERADLNGQPYGFSMTATYDGPYVADVGADRLWSTNITANGFGRIVDETSDFETPDPPD
jgi:hypothetical protein